jgi:phosphoglycolate phosphatase-like HAD superfamily hydrolase
VAVVGDTVSDLASGTAAGAGAVIGVLSGAHDESTLAAVPHTALIGDVTALIGLLEGDRRVNRA